MTTMLRVRIKGIDGVRPEVEKPAGEPPAHKCDCCAAAGVDSDLRTAWQERGGKRDDGTWGAYAWQLIATCDVDGCPRNSTFVIEVRS